MKYNFTNEEISRLQQVFNESYLNTGEAFYAQENAIKAVIAALPEPSAASAVLRPIAEMPGDVPKWCFRQYFRISDGDVVFSHANVDATFFIDIARPTNPDIERAKFEETFPNLDKELTPSGMYKNCYSQACWEGWRAKSEAKP